MSQEQFRKAGIAMALILSLVMLSEPAQAENQSTSLTPEQMLGKKIFFLKISSPEVMSCAACHARKTGWTGPNSFVNAHGGVYPGAVRERFGNRKPPTSGYATLSPRFYYNVDGLFEGGNFWDGRATGWELGNPAADQAQGPFLNPVEQNESSEKAVCDRVAASDFAGLFEEVWGTGSLNCSVSRVAATYDKIALSVAAYEGSPGVNQFSSKFDAWRAGKTRLTGKETAGFNLFQGKAKCVLCHMLTDEDPHGEDLFTDFTFDNLGIPRNPENPFYRMDRVLLGNGQPINPAGKAWVDPGLGGFLRSLADSQNQAWRSLPFVTNIKNMSSQKLNRLAAENEGKHKVPTLRNVDAKPERSSIKAYGHNGYFKSLWSIVHFYNTRDVKPECPDPFTTEKDALAQGCWPEPEIPENVNRNELGNLRLTRDEELALVQFLKTLSDGWTPQ